jgi:D-alanine-D-alanine ligase-like ATP-grasp enzyme
MEAVLKKRIGILRGGADEHYYTSLARGGEIISHIHENLSDKYIPIDILIDRDHAWHVGGLPARPSDLVNKVDVVWNFAHPSFYNILESLSVPTIGTDVFLGALLVNRDMLRKHVREAGVSMARHLLLPMYQEDFDGARNKYAMRKAKEVFEKFGSPWIIKSYSPDKNTSIYVAKTFPELVNGISDVLDHKQSILIEELIPGKIASVHSVRGFRGEDVYAFPPNVSFGAFSEGEKTELIKLAKKLHDHLSASHYLKSDFVLNNRGRVYLLNIEAVPNLKEGSLFHEVCASVGAKAHQVIDHILGSVNTQ